MVGDVRAANAKVTLAAVRALDDELVARRDARRKRKCVSRCAVMTALPGSPGMRRAVEMARTERERAARRAREHQHVAVLRGADEARDGMRIGPRPRLDRDAGGARRVPRRVQQPLRDVRLGVRGRRRGRSSRRRPARAIRYRIIASTSTKMYHFARCAPVRRRSGKTRPAESGRRSRARPPASSCGDRHRAAVGADERSSPIGGESIGRSQSAVSTRCRRASPPARSSPASPRSTAARTTSRRCCR